MNSFLSIWRNELSNKKFKINFIFTLIFLAAALITLSNFLTYNDTLSGVAYTDPILKYFEPVDVTWVTFLLIYSALLAGILTLAKYPRYLIIAFQSYSIMVLFRIIVMYSLPLDPVPDTIPLEDPLVQMFGTGEILMRDLFFSGHTSTMFLLFLTAQNKKMKITFLIFTILVGLAVLIQHAHYTVDVLAAPFFSYTSYRISILLNKKLNFITREN
jgi:membrane-associated phospholipid phosphatase